MRTRPLISLTNRLRRKVPVGLEEEDRSRGPSRCSSFVRYEGSMTVIGINVVGLMMLFRYAPSLRVS